MLVRHSEPIARSFPGEQGTYYLCGSLALVDGPFLESQSQSREKTSHLGELSKALALTVLTSEELGGSLPPPHLLTLASSPEGYSLGGWERWPPSDTCYRSLAFPCSPSVPGACKSLIPGPLPAPPLSRTSLPPPSWTPRWHRCL